MSKKRRRALMIQCDYCNAPAVYFMSRGNASSRSFACSLDTSRAQRAYSPSGAWMDPYLEGRSRHEGRSFEEVAKVLSGQRKNPLGPIK